MKPNTRKRLVDLITLFSGTRPKLHRIPFGPLRGKTICMNLAISPRMYFGMDEPWLAQQARALIQPDAVVYDIGAHIGYTTLLFADLAKRGTVHAFEIVPSTAELYLKKTIESNHLHNVEVHTVGLSDKPCTVDLPVGPAAMTSLFWGGNPHNRPTEACRVVSLDAYVKARKLSLPSFIKIDIEGAENGCLLGGSDLVRRCRPRMIIAFHSVNLLKVGYGLLTGFGYVLTSQQNLPLDEKAVGTLKEPYNENVLCLPQEDGLCVSRGVDVC